MATYLLSYPSPSFVPPGSTGQPPDSAHRALAQWLELCDHITRAGGRILVIDPPSEPTPAAAAVNQVYASRCGAPFLNPPAGGDALFLRAHPSGAELSIDTDPVCRALRAAGLAVQVAKQRWQGQAEIIPLPRNRFILTYGPETDIASCEEIKRLLPMGAHVLCVETMSSNGLSGIGHFVAKGGASVLLVERAALRSHTPDDLGKFVMGGTTELSILGSEDVASRAVETLCVRGTAFVPAGTSTQLRALLVRRGFQVIAVDVSALFGPHGGGPRALCNEWPGFVLSEDSPSYATRRDALISLLDRYAPAAHS
jgi:hypothetical protein